MTISRFLLGLLLLFVQSAALSLNLTEGQNLDALGSDTSSSIRFFLHTRNINELELTRNNLTDVNFDIFIDTVFLIHGWQEGPNTILPQELTSAYLEKGSYNVIVVDWSELAAAPYLNAASNTIQVGRETANFIQFMQENITLDINRTSIVGHSLGAHVAGIAGRKLDGMLGSITGLDPAGPTFLTKSNNEKLTKDDAKFVQIIHTNTGVLGTTLALGHADFWPNCGGPIQPGCELLGRCSHDASILYYGESLKTGGFQAVQCSDCGSFSLGLCDTAENANMGNDAADKSVGNFYLYTNSEPPYSRT